MVPALKRILPILRVLCRRFYFGSYDSVIDFNYSAHLEATLFWFLPTGPAPMGVIRDAAARQRRSAASWQRSSAPMLCG